jgi:hypothetical protein
VVAAGSENNERDRSKESGQSWAYCDSMVDEVLQQAGVKHRYVGGRESYIANISKVEGAVVGKDEIFGTGGTNPENIHHIHAGDVLVWGKGKDRVHYAIAVGDDFEKDGKRYVPTLNPNGDGGNTTIIDMNISKYTDPAFTSTHPFPGELLGIIPLEKTAEIGNRLWQEAQAKQNKVSMDDRAAAAQQKYPSIDGAALADASAGLVRHGAIISEQGVSGYASTPVNISAEKQRFV